MVKKGIVDLLGWLAEHLFPRNVAAKQEREKLQQIRLEHEAHWRSDVQHRDIIDRVHSDGPLVQHIRDNDRQLEQYLFHEGDTRRTNEFAAVDSQFSQSD
jgi:hypothetical protein